MTFKLGYEVHDFKELEIEDSMVLTCCDIYGDTMLDVELIYKQVVQLMMLIENLH
ncbi:MAG: hypothetical protein ACTS8H_01030 [Arsenophonus sp. NC-PE1-MAG3]